MVLRSLFVVCAILNRPVNLAAHTAYQICTNPSSHTILKNILIDVSITDDATMHWFIPSMLLTLDSSTFAIVISNGFGDSDSIQIIDITDPVKSNCSIYHCEGN